jgi:hypothetical protein
MYAIVFAMTVLTTDDGWTISSPQRCWLLTAIFLSVRVSAAPAVVPRTNRLELDESAAGDAVAFSTHSLDGRVAAP